MTDERTGQEQAAKGLRSLAEAEGFKDERSRRAFIKYYTFFWGLVIALLIYRHYLLASMWVLGPDWIWAGKSSLILQTLLRMVWVVFLVVYLVHRWR
jgi:hypothetical protein